MKKTTMIKILLTEEEYAEYLRLTADCFCRTPTSCKDCLLERMGYDCTILGFTVPTIVEKEEKA